MPTVLSTNIVIVMACYIFCLCSREELGNSILMQVVRPVGAEGESWHCKPKQADLEEDKYEYKEYYQNSI